MNDFTAKLWYGAGGVAWFGGNGITNQFTIGLTPQVGYKFNNWLSAGPRLGAIYTGVKGPTDIGGRERVNLWNFSAAAFARARISMFYIQPEFGLESQAFYFTDFRGAIVTDVNLNPAVQRENQTVLLIGGGYNAGGETVSTDIGLFYNLFDDVESNVSPITFRIMITFGY
jgi:hypothetical protein